MIGTFAKLGFYREAFGTAAIPGSGELLEKSDLLNKKKLAEPVVYGRYSVPT